MGRLDVALTTPCDITPTSRGNDLMKQTNGPPESPYNITRLSLGKVLFTCIITYMHHCVETLY